MAGMAVEKSTALQTEPLLIETTFSSRLNIVPQGPMSPRHRHPSISNRPLTALNYYDMSSRVRWSRIPECRLAPAPDSIIAALSSQEAVTALARFCGDPGICPPFFRGVPHDVQTGQILR